MEKRTKTYLTMAHLGAIAALGWPIAIALGWPDFFVGLFFGMLLIPLAMAPFKRMRDEYIDELWNAGTSLAFIVLILAFFFAPFAEGIWDGFTNPDGHSRVPDATAGYLAIIAFYAGFHVKWLASR